MAPMELPTDLTPELVPLYWLLGTWEGGGRLGAGEESDPPFAQQVTFRDSGLEFVEYRAETSLTDESGARLRTLSVETGFWALDRPRVESDVGPGLTPADVVPVYRSAEDLVTAARAALDSPAVPHELRSALDPHLATALERTR